MMKRLKHVFGRKKLERVTITFSFLLKVQISQKVISIYLPQDTSRNT